MCKSDIPVDNGIVAHTADPLSVDPKDRRMQVRLGPETPQEFPVRC